jgi:hypothetical protein
MAAINLMSSAQPSHDRGDCFSRGPIRVKPKRPKLKRIKKRSSSRWKRPPDTIFMSDPASRAQEQQLVSSNDRSGTAEAIVDANLDLAERAAVPQRRHAIVRQRRAGAERDVVVFRLG